MSGRDWVGHPEVREGLKGPPGGPVRVREALPGVRKGSGGPTGSLGGVGWSSQRSLKGWETLTEVWEALPEV